WLSLEHGPHRGFIPVVATGHNYDKGLLVNVEAFEHVNERALVDVGGMRKTLAVGKRPTVVHHHGAKAHHMADFTQGLSNVARADDQQGLEAGLDINEDTGPVLPTRHRIFNHLALGRDGEELGRALRDRGSERLHGGWVKWQARSEHGTILIEGQAAFGASGQHGYRVNGRYQSGRTARPCSLGQGMG